MIESKPQSNLENDGASHEGGHQETRARLSEESFTLAALPTSVDRLSRSTPGSPGAEAVLPSYSAQPITNYGGFDIPRTLLPGAQSGLSALPAMDTFAAPRGHEQRPFNPGMGSDRYAPAPSYAPGKAATGYENLGPGSYMPNHPGARRPEQYGALPGKFPGAPERGEMRPRMNGDFNTTGMPRAGDPVTDPRILSDIGRKSTGGSLEPTYIGVMHKESYKGPDGKKHTREAPAWLPKAAAHAFIMANEELAQIGKRITLASEGSGNSQINSAGRTKTQQAIATGLHAAPGHSRHEKDGALDIRNYADADVRKVVQKYGFQQGDRGTPIPGDAWHFSFKPQAERMVAQMWDQRSTRYAARPNTGGDMAFQQQPEAGSRSPLPGPMRPQYERPRYS